LSRVLGSRLPGAVCERLKSRKTATCRLALRQAAELARLRSELGAHGIEFIPMKGVMLSIQLYGDPGMRSTRDLDLLVKPESLDKADGVLRRDGYKRKFPDFEPTPKQKDWMHRHQVHCVYYHEQRQQLVELHWRLAQWRTEHVGKILPDFDGRIQGTPSPRSPVLALFSIAPLLWFYHYYIKRKA
jgi:hypothetical protein